MKSRFIRWLMRQPEVQEEIRKAVAAAIAEEKHSFKQAIRNQAQQFAEQERCRQW